MVQVPGSIAANLPSDSSRIFLILVGVDFETSANVAKPAAVKASAALGPIPSILVKSSFVLDFLGAAFLVAAFLAVGFFSAVSFLAAGFLAVSFLAAVFVAVGLVAVFFSLAFALGAAFFAAGFLAAG